MFLLYHAYVYLEFLILACTIYILAPAPLAGARIEIPLHTEADTVYLSLPSRERGLKFGNIASLPSAMRRSPRGSAD